MAVDLRKGETFGHAYSAVLSFENRKQMLIPRGFAHGYLTLEDDTLMQWCVDNDFRDEAPDFIKYIFYSDDITNSRIIVNRLQNMISVEE